MCFNHTAAMLSPEGFKTFVFCNETRSQTFQLEAGGTKFIAYGQYGRSANEGHYAEYRKNLCYR